MSDRANGFTLIELMVALAIFALIAGAGVLLLGNSVSAQGAIKLRLDDLAAVQRADGTLSADLGQATARISRTELGTLAPAFFANPGGESAPILQFVRGGRANLGDSPRSSLQKVEYWLREGRLERRSYDAVDGATAREPAPLLTDLESAALRFRNARGEWIGQWMPTQPDLLPLAVELRLARRGAPPVTLVYAVGPGPEEQTRVASDGGVPGA
ncbi:type II secretion system minor pseudopilin GspJ [Sphingobium algorifonticola]|uniref:Type II secretion system protein J n=1 Tax=Sphingobium algorifonticola TaxID=2008318 RepID=A0A437J748_9SPHN|nr:type II secretion system minor pseudopilin GspJ [Sphingobium algorifonticola]RVT41001.1 type II secretion system protein GspJ [Sphingobium algorifonticola]